MRQWAIVDRTAVESPLFSYPQVTDAVLIESRRRAYLTAMQVVNWLPRTELPFAAPSRPELLQALEPFDAFEASR